MRGVNAWRAWTTAASCYAVVIALAIGDGAAAGDEEPAVQIFQGDGTMVTQHTTSDRPDSSKWRMTGPIVRKSNYCPIARFTNGADAGDTAWDMTWELADDHGLIVRTTRRDWTVVEKDYIRLTVSGEVLIRERRTTESRQPGGTRTFETSMSAHYDSPHCPGELKFIVDEKGHRQWLAAAGAKKGIDPDDPGAVCPLDDRSKVPDEELEKFACARWLSYDDKGRETFVVLRDGRIDRNSFYLWTDETARGAKFAYAENAEFSKIRPRTVDEAIRWRNTWQTRMHAQAVDDQGRMRTDLPRVVWFIHRHRSNVEDPFTETRLMLIEQDMDYTSGPRPKIKSYSIWHYLRNVNRVPSAPGAWDLGPEKCKDYRVQTEDVQDGDPALQGEWVATVVPDGEAFRKTAEAEGFQALLPASENKDVAPDKKQPAEQARP